MAMSEDFQLEPSSDDDEFEQVLKIFEASYSRIAKEKGEKTVISVMINEFMRKNGYEKLTAVTVEAIQGHKKEKKIGLLTCFLEGNTRHRQSQPIHTLTCPTHKEN